MESPKGLNILPRTDLGYSRVTEKKNIILKSSVMELFLCLMSNILDAAKTFEKLQEIQYELYQKNTY